MTTKKTKKTNVSIEFQDLNPSDLAKVTDLIDTLGYAIVGYSITTGDVNPKPHLTSPVYRGMVSEVGTPYAPKHAADESKSDVEATEAVPLDIQPRTTNFSPENLQNKDKSRGMKSNLKKYL